MTTKLTTLKNALEARIEEVQEYQINIDNFIRAIDKINNEYADNEDMLIFRDQLLALLKDNQREQLKAIIIKDVIAEQITEMESKN